MAAKVNDRTKYKKIKFKHENLYVERGLQLMEKFNEETIKAEVDWEFGFIPYEDGVYVGRFECGASGEDEKKVDEILTKINSRDDIKAIVNPPLLVKAWDWLTKTKG